MNIEKEKRAIQYLKTFEPQDEPYYLCECFTWWVGDNPNQLALFDMDDDSLFEAGIL